MCWFAIAGGGATQIIMPYLTLAIGHHHPLHDAWRIAFFIPTICHILMALLILFFGQVRPGGRSVSANCVFVRAWHHC